MANVIIYTTPSCVYCKMAKAFFMTNNVKYIEKNVITDDEAREAMIKKSGQMGVPVIDVDGKIIVGFDKNGLSDLLNIK
ncbi:MAG: glutaredoxin domain-containing protein [bacterium]|nr:glutaredoxin domain-containing protein [bacterium]